MDWPRASRSVLFGVLMAKSAIALIASSCFGSDSSGAAVLDESSGRDWPIYGRTYGQQHYSPLTQINHATIGRLGLVWSFDLGLGNSVTEPIAVDGVLYFASGLSVVHAFDVASGKKLWQYDPNVAEHAGPLLRAAWGVRGIASWHGKIYVATPDGRLIAINAKTGELVWEVDTSDEHSRVRISGAPRVFAGIVIVGHGNGGTGLDRGYVTAYDAEAGKKLWRFYTVPGNPARAYDGPTMAMAAKTWAGSWWKSGGGANVWNAMAYDSDAGTLFIGTGSGSPWNRRERSADQGDNLFVSSIIALDGKTGTYKWHYQVNPGDSWDYDAAMDIELADLLIDGTMRKVLMQAPKNGFYYVIDRLTGKLISARPYSRVTWAERIDLATGRPVENPTARYRDGAIAEIWPSGYGAHNWIPMAYSPKRQLTFIPVMDGGTHWSDTGSEFDRNMTEGHVAHDGTAVTGRLVAWDPVRQQLIWAVPHPTGLNGGVLATGGDLVFQGTVDGRFRAYAAGTGRILWSFAAQAPMMATPISYEVNGKQYVTVLTGLGMGLAAFAGATSKQVEQYGIDPRTQARRVLTFALNGKATLPPARLPPLPVVHDFKFQPNPFKVESGRTLYGRRCMICHGVAVIGSSHAPDLRRSAVPFLFDAFSGIVRDGALVRNGMPAFPELTDSELVDLQQYIGARAASLRPKGPH